MFPSMVIAIIFLISLTFHVRSLKKGSWVETTKRERRIANIDLDAATDGDERGSLE